VPRCHRTEVGPGPGSGCRSQRRDARHVVSHASCRTQPTLSAVSALVPVFAAIPAGDLLLSIILRAGRTPRQVDRVFVTAPSRCRRRFTGHGKQQRRPSGLSTPSRALWFLRQWTMIDDGTRWPRRRPPICRLSLSSTSQLTSEESPGRPFAAQVADGEAAISRVRSTGSVDHAAADTAQLIAMGARDLSTWRPPATLARAPRYRRRPFTECDLQGRRAN
jgi:hypothetical protein